MAVFAGFYSPPTGNTIVLYDVDLVKQDLLNQFNTHKGERVMNTDYGFIGWDLLFELDNPNVPSQLQQDAIRIIGMDPRVSLISIDVQNIDYGYVISIDLQFLVLNTVDQLIVVLDQRTTSSEEAS